LKAAAVPKTVGILGGMGPAATARFLRLFVGELNNRGAFEDGDYPRMIMLGLPLQEWDVGGAVDKQAVSDQVRDGVEWLARSGAEIIGVPCNSVHEFYYRFRAVGVPIVNIIDETLQRASATVVGVLCSRQTRAAGLYERPTLETLYVDDQGRVDEAIRSVMLGSPISIDPLILSLCQRGAGTVILGCTELSCCPHAWPAVDSSAALAAALASRV
jgi:aspartate racemase